MEGFSNQRALLLNLPKNKPINITFKDIRLQVAAGPFTKERKSVLKGLTGNFKSGELTAIMGPSGAGKSSLLNILTGFQTQGMTGELRTNGEQYRPGCSSARRMSCYIMQDDQLNPLFSVLETMCLAADLKLGNALSPKAKQLIVEEILDSLGLGGCKRTRCCLLSGGQKKRLSIALELIDNPPIMYLDEPTTGLDSSSTNQLVRMLKRLARGGRTIICTIHQPSATIFEMFDHVYVISAGLCVYQGSSGNVVPFLHSVGLHCPTYHNPADFMLDVVNGEFGEFSEHLVLSAQDPSWRISPPASQGSQQEKDLDSDKNKENNKACVLISNPSEWVRMPVLLRRCVLHLHRDWTSTYLKLLLHLMVSVTLGLTFKNAGKDADKAISNLSYIMCSMVYMCFTSLLPAILKLPSELKVLKKEQFNNWYKFRTFYIAFLAINIPLQMIFCVIYVSISYYLSSQILELERYSKFLYVCLLLIVCSECLGLAFGVLSNPTNGVFIGSILLAILMAFAGFLALLPHMPEFFYYVSYGGFMRYALEAMVVSLYGGGRAPLDCPPPHLYCHFRTPAKLLQEVGMSDTNYWFDTTLLSSFTLFFGVASYFMLNRKIKSTA